jgi:hypothetical protein
MLQFVTTLSSICFVMYINDFPRHTQSMIRIFFCLLCCIVTLVVQGFDSTVTLKSRRMPWDEVASGD